MRPKRPDRIGHPLDRYLCNVYNERQPIFGFHSPAKLLWGAPSGELPPFDELFDASALRLL